MPQAAAASRSIPTRKRDPSLLMLIARWYHPHACAAVVVSVLLAAYLPNRRWQDLAQAALWLSYGVMGEDGSTLYGTGWRDVVFVTFHVFSLTLLRALLAALVFGPIARHFRVAIPDVSKFKENMWAFLYYTVAWTTGLLVWMQSPAWKNLEAVWVGYPHLYVPALAKLYYLLQLAFWIHMVFVTVIEEWRKDFLLFIVHHFTTIALVSASWFTHYTRFGTLVLVEQDLADIFLPLAKALRYAKQEKVATSCFVLFAATWFPTRHGIYYWLLYSIYFESPRLVTAGWEPERGAYYSRTFITVWTAVLVALQIMLLMWARELVVAIYRALGASRVQDHRSDSEDEGETRKRR